MQCKTGQKTVSKGGWAYFSSKISSAVHEASSLLQNCTSKFCARVASCPMSLSIHSPKHVSCTQPHTPRLLIKIATEEQFRESVVLPPITSCDRIFSCSPRRLCFIGETPFVPFIPEQTYRHFQCHSTLCWAPGFPSALQAHTGLEFHHAWLPPDSAAEKLGLETFKSIRQHNSVISCGREKVNNMIKQGSNKNAVDESSI